MTISLRRPWRRWRDVWQREYSLLWLSQHRQALDWQNVVKYRGNARSATLHRTSMALAMLYDGESSHTQLYRSEPRLSVCTNGRETSPTTALPSGTPLL